MFLEIFCFTLFYQHCFVYLKVWAQTINLNIQNAFFVIHHFSSVIVIVIVRDKMDGPENLKQMSREKKNQGLKTPSPSPAPFLKKWPLLKKRWCINLVDEHEKGGCSAPSKINTKIFLNFFLNNKKNQLFLITIFHHEKVNSDAV
jgi:hypothetical protein